MPATSLISCHLIHGTNPDSTFPEVAIPSSREQCTSCCVPVGENPSPSADYSVHELPYGIHWSLDSSLLRDGGLQVQVEIDGCQKGQPRCYEGIGPDGLLPSSPLEGIDDGLWVVPDSSRRRPWVMAPVKTTHPHSAIAEKYILDRVGSVQVTFSRAQVVPTPHVVPLVPVFNGGAPLPERMRQKLSHWTKLGFIEKFSPVPELGLVAEEVKEVLATFIFNYRSQDLLEKLMPTLRGGSPVLLVTPELKVAFPTSPEEPRSDDRSIHSSELLSSPHSDGRPLPEKSRSFTNAMRRALSSASHPRQSFDSAVGSEISIEREEGSAKLVKNKPGGKRVRAVSLRVAKRYSLIGQKPLDMSVDRKSQDEREASSAVAHSDGEVMTVENLARKVSELQTEISKIKQHLNL